MGDFMDDYPRNGGWDEMFDPAGTPARAYKALHEALQSLSAEDFAAGARPATASFRDQGITFSLSGEERPFPLDLVPRILSAEEWPTIEAGVGQRVRALEAFLADVYGPGRILDDGVVPRRLVTTSTHFHRAAAGHRAAQRGAGPRRRHRPRPGRRRPVPGPRGQPAHARRASPTSSRTAGRWPGSSPSCSPATGCGPSTTTRPGCWRRCGQPTPAGVADPTVVVLTPGVYNSAYFEHSFLARQMGVELVEGRDLVCRSNIVYMRTTEGEQRVDVVYRRIDDDFLDPLHFRPDSVSGCPGIVNAARAGNVTIANAVGNGVADDKLRLPLRPRHDPLLPRRGADPGQRRHLPARGARPAGGRRSARLDELVLKPVDGSGGYGLVIGPAAPSERAGRACAP